MWYSISSMTKHIRCTKAWLTRSFSQLFSIVSTFFRTYSWSVGDITNSILAHLSVCCFHKCHAVMKLTSFFAFGCGKGIYPTVIVILVSTQGTMSKSSLTAPSAHEELSSHRGRDHRNMDLPARELEMNSITTERHQAEVPPDSSDGRVASGTMLSSVVWPNS